MLILTFFSVKQIFGTSDFARVDDVHFSAAATLVVANCASHFVRFGPFPNG
jgi:hypothetical protein